MSMVDYRTAKKLLRRIELHGLPEGDFGRPWANPMHPINIRHKAEQAVYCHNQAQARKIKLKAMVRGQQVEAIASTVGRGFWHDGDKLGKINHYGQFIGFEDERAYIKEDLSYIMQNRATMDRDNRRLLLDNIRALRLAMSK